jgi:3-dehydroquinate dehydratase type I
MRGYNCDIQKFACKINEDKDNINLIRLLTSKTQNESMIVLGMGQKSKLIRTTTILLGGYLTFGTVDSQVSASGQMSVSDVKSTIKLLD